MSTDINVGKKYAGRVVTVYQDYSTSSYVNPQRGNDFQWTLDLNGHTYTYTGSGNAFLLKGEGQSFTLDDTAPEGQKGALAVTEKANAAITMDGACKNCAVTICEDATVSGGTVLVMGQNSKLDVYGTVATGNKSAAIQTNGSNTADSAITLYGTARVTSNSTPSTTPAPAP